MTDASSAVWGNEETQFFYALTPDKILDAVEAFGYRCTGRCLPLNSMENRVYEVEIECEDEDAPKKDRFRVVKFYRPGRWSYEQVRAEHDFVRDLAGADIPVVPPEEKDGESVLPVPETTMYYSVTPKISGRSPDELSDELLERVGRLIARMHTVGAAKEAPERVELSPESFGVQNLTYLKESGTLTVECEDRYLDLANRICEESAPLFEDVEYQRVHGDAHLGNLLLGDEGLFFVDFDDMLRAPCVQDIWLALSTQGDGLTRKQEILLSAYEEMRPFDRRSLRLIEPLRALRFIHFSAWIAHRWEDPAFKRVFDQFGTSEYWNIQISDLENQLRLIREASTRGNPNVY